MVGVVRQKKGQRVSNHELISRCMTHVQLSVCQAIVEHNYLGFNYSIPFPLIEVFHYASMPL
jgi:hypothetical protein